MQKGDRRGPQCSAEQVQRSPGIPRLNQAGGIACDRRGGEGGEVENGLHSECRQASFPWGRRPWSRECHTVHISKLCMRRHDAIRQDVRPPTPSLCHSLPPKTDHCRTPASHHICKQDDLVDTLFRELGSRRGVRAGVSPFTVKRRSPRRHVDTARCFRCRGRWSCPEMKDQTSSSVGLTQQRQHERRTLCSSAGYCTPLTALQHFRTARHVSVTASQSENAC